MEIRLVHTVVLDLGVTERILSIIREARGDGQLAQAVLASLAEIKGSLSAIQQQLNVTNEKETSIIMKLEDFQARLDQIDANTTASASAAVAVQTTLSNLRDQISQITAAAGMSADDEAKLLSKLDAAVATTGNLATFLQGTASGPATAPEPTPVEVHPALDTPVASAAAVEPPPADPGGVQETSPFIDHA